MDEPRDRRPLADDEDFLDRLSELDAGLAPGAPRARQDADAASADPRASIAAPFDALEADAERPASDAEARRRPLLALFPPEPRHTPARRARRPPDAPGNATPLVDRTAGVRNVVPIAADEHDAFYGLREKAFGESADPRFFYHSAPHDAVVQQLLTAIRRREGLVLLIGPHGVGKTTVCRVVLDEIDRRTLTSLLTDRIETPAQMLARILADFGVLSAGDAGRSTSVPDLRAALQSFVDSLAPLDASAVVVVDDAQALPAAVFDEVRSLCEAAHVSPLQVIVAGDDRLAAMLRRPENRALQQRFAVRCTVQPLPPEEVGDYVVHRLSVAGESRVEFEEAALARVAALSGGLPRVVNQICDRVLWIGRERSAEILTEALVDAAAADVGVIGPRSAAARVLMRAATIVFVAACLAAGAAAAAWVFRDSVARALAGWRMVPVPPDAPPRRLPAPLAPPSGSDAPAGPR